MTRLKLGNLPGGGSCNYELIAFPYPHTDIAVTHAILVGSDNIHIIKYFPPVIYYFVHFVGDYRSRLIPVAIEFYYAFHINYYCFS